MSNEINLLSPIKPFIGNEELKRVERETKQKLKRIIEALLFVSNEPISFQKIREIAETFYPFKQRVVRELIEDLQEEYITQNRAFRLKEVSLGFILKSCEEFSPYIDMLFRNKRSEKLSQASAEVLAIIAYKQPITRPQIDEIRGVDSSGILQNLAERNLIEQVGKLEAPGKPSLYGITSHFLTHFGLRDLKELPPFTAFT